MHCVHKIVLIFLFIGFSSALSLAQGAHYSYPFSVECTAGESRTIEAKFTAEHKGSNYSPAYNWTVSQGTIIEGQGTPVIKVEEPKEAGGTSVTITLNRSFSEPHYTGVQLDGSCDFLVVPEPEAVLFDEFGTAGSNCEEGFARMDSFLTELMNNPNDQGYVVIYDDVKDLRAGRRRRQQLTNHLIMRRLDRSRIAFVSGGMRKEAVVQFWSVPPGANPPEGKPDVFDVTIPVRTERPSDKPYIYAIDHTDGIPGCGGNLYDLAEYAAELKIDPKNRGKIVIGESSRTRFSRRSREILSELAANGITRNRLTTIYKYVRPNRLAETTELWIIPPAKKR